MSDTVTTVTIKRSWTGQDGQECIAESHAETRPDEYGEFFKKVLDLLHETDKEEPARPDNGPLCGCHGAPPHDIMCNARFAAAGKNV